MTNQLFLEKIDALGLRETLESILLEVERAENKFPFWPKDIIHAAAILGEESGELTRAALQYVYEQGELMETQKEAIQTGAMALRFLKNNYD